MRNKNLTILVVAVSIMTLFSLSQNAHADPTISLSPYAGPVGSQITVSGSGFIPYDHVYVDFGASDGSDETFIANQIIDDKGNLPTTTFTVPSVLDRGSQVVHTNSYSVWVTDTDSTHDNAITPFTVPPPSIRSIPFMPRPLLYHYFTMSFSSASITIPFFGSHLTTLTLTSQNNFSGPISFSASGETAGFAMDFYNLDQNGQLISISRLITGSLADHSQSLPVPNIESGNPAQVPISIYVDNTVQPGTYPITITGTGIDSNTGRKITESATIEVTVVDPTNLSMLSQSQSLPLIVTTPTNFATVTSLVKISGLAQPGSVLSYGFLNLDSWTTITGTVTADAATGMWSITKTLVPSQCEFYIWNASTYNGISTERAQTIFTVQPSQTAQLSPKTNIPIIITPKVDTTVNNPVTISGIVNPGDIVLLTDSNGMADSATADPSTGVWSFTETLAPGLDTVSIYEAGSSGITYGPSTIQIPVASTSTSSSSGS